MTRDYEHLASLVRAHLEEEPQDPGRVGCYRLEERIGRGSAGEVFRALDPAGHEVALKLLHRRWRGPRYARELELLERSSLREGVVSLLDAGSSPRGPYLVFELAEGGSLRSRFREKGKFAWPEAALLIEHVATTLEALHREGIVHRDLKPENILLRADGRPLISDFGLAKDLQDEDGELTTAGSPLGTIGYMAPELLDANREKLGPWTDVFALGAVLHELMTGELPFSGKNILEAAKSIRNDTVKPVPNVPPALNAAVKRALAKVPDERFASGGELARALREARV
ncbi:MAG TPA: serine/threonine-protein kinase [Planctomycetota bacterium]|nr:serine/threonine-protein kinase [Planctomycetota bacterium]